MRIERLPGNPIVRPHMDGRMGDNLNGPSLIRTPDWLPRRLGRYYLYFAHHSGRYIRMAYADRLEGPWKMYEPGTLTIEQAGFNHHVASPDVHVDEANRRLVMYFHGAFRTVRPFQVTHVAYSHDGLQFEAHPQVLGKAYWRVFTWNGRRYGVAKPGLLFRSLPGREWDAFEAGPRIFPLDWAMRHLALDVVDDTLYVFYSRIGDTPEHIVCSTIRLTDDWHDWEPSSPFSVLTPAESWEGAGLPLEPSRSGAAAEPVREVRDPGIFREGERAYLLYSVAGERGIAIAKIEYGAGRSRTEGMRLE